MWSPAKAEDMDTVVSRVDTTFIQSYKDKLIVKMDIENDKDYFRISGAGANYDIRPNLGPAKILSFSYRWAYLAVEYLPRFIDPIEGTGENKGKSEGFGISLGYSAPTWVADINYRNVKGYYLENTADFVPGFDPSADEYIQFPDLQTWMIHGSVLYKLNPNYSLLAVQTQTEAQRKSAVTLMPGLGYNYMNVDNDFANSTSAQKSSTVMLLANINANGTLVIHRNWYLTAGARFGFGGYYMWLTTKTIDGVYESTLTDRVVRGRVHAGIGFNSQRFISGGELIYQRSFGEQGGGAITLDYTRLAFQLFVGYRFNAPRFLQKTLDAIESVPARKK
jgi:hypothetical protein